MLHDGRAPSGRDDGLDPFAQRPEGRGRAGVTSVELDRQLVADPLGERRREAGGVDRDGQWSRAMDRGGREVAPFARRGIVDEDARRARRGDDRRVRFIVVGRGERQEGAVEIAGFEASRRPRRVR
jgi:hypothetical protein